MRLAGGSRQKLRERGATLVEFALVVALFAVVAIGSIEALTNKASDDFSESAANVGHPEARSITTTTMGSGGPLPTTPPPPPSSSTTTHPPTTTTTEATTTSTTAPTTTTTTPPPTTVPAQMQAPRCFGVTCVLEVEAPGGGVVRWTVDGTPVGTGSTLDHVFPSEPGSCFLIFCSSTSTSYTVVAEVDPSGQRLTATVSCSGSWIVGTSCRPD